MVKIYLDYTNNIVAENQEDIKENILKCIVSFDTEYKNNITELLK